MIVLAIETSTKETGVAIGGERGIVAASVLATGAAGHERLIPEIEHLLRSADLSLAQVGGIAVGLGPGLFTGLRVGVTTARTLAQALSLPIVGIASSDALAFAARYSRRSICTVVDARRREVFFAFYRPVPGGVAREGGFEAGSASRLSAELEARAEATLLVGDGALVYRQELEGLAHVEIASVAHAYPSAAALVELAIPRFEREDYDALDDVRPYYVRKSDAEIAWDNRRAST